LCGELRTPGTEAFYGRDAHGSPDARGRRRA